MSKTADRPHSAKTRKKVAKKATGASEKVEKKAVGAASKKVVASAKKAAKKAAKKVAKKAAQKVAKKAPKLLSKSVRTPVKRARKVSVSLPGFPSFAEYPLVVSGDSSDSVSAVSFELSEVELSEAFGRSAVRRPVGMVEIETTGDNLAGMQLEAPRRPLNFALAQLSTKLSAVPASTHVSMLRAASLSVSPDMDHRLQVAVANLRTGKRFLKVASANGDEVPVIALVSDVEAWKSDPNVVHGAEIGRIGDHSMLVTGRIPIASAEALRSQDWVISLKASQPVFSSLHATVESMGVGPLQLANGVDPKGGEGVVVGIVDFGGDFAHPNFRDKHGNTRLLALWNQSDKPRFDNRVNYGRVYDRAEIDAALASNDPYGALRYFPERASHGTHVMDIAAGNGNGTTVAGVAPAADLVFVEVSADDVPWDGPETTRYHFGDSVQLVEAVRFIFDTAGDRPCVVNLSLGTNGGPHDGSSLVEQAIDALVRERPARAVVIAASNSQQDGIHIDGQLPAAGEVDIGWKVFGHAGGEFELWYDQPAELEMSLVAPDGTTLMTLAPGTNEALEANESIAVFASSRLHEPNNRSHVIAIWLAPGLDGGNWTVRIRSANGKAANYHAWIERMDHAQGHFINSTPTHTLGSISTGHETVVVGSYNAHVSSFPISPFSSCGPTRDGRQKPEISAPGHHVRAACSREKDALERMSGTSMAAPAVSGLIALLLAEAKRNGLSLTSSAIRDQLQAHSEDGPPVGTQWHPRYGAGRASGKAIK